MTINERQQKVQKKVAKALGRSPSNLTPWVCRNSASFSSARRRKKNSLVLRLLWNQRLAVALVPFADLSSLVAGGVSLV